MRLRTVLFTFLLGAAPAAAFSQAAANDDAPPPDYVAYDKAPEPQKIVQPKYPAAARNSGVEGTVWVKLWVGKDGKVKKAVVGKSDSDALNQAATDAATQWTFTPAMTRNAPVSVWVRVPFKFRLTKEK